jgi:hypothetical protein
MKEVVMADSHDWVDILDPGTRDALDHCHGPDPTGACSKPTDDGVVGCAGCRIAAAAAGPEYWLLLVPPGTRHCPLSRSLEAAY